jgi:L-iditol 2-dehydrogenase
VVAPAPDTMRAAVLHAPHRVALEQRPVPVPAPEQVLVRVRSVGLCGSDVHYYEHGRIGDHVVSSPLVLGHEPSGEIVACGDRATRHRPGQRVSLEPGVPCLTCTQCLAGRYNLCPRMTFFATPPVDGAFCEYVVLHEAFAHPVPDSMSDDSAALLEPLSVAVWACTKADVSTGSRVLVTGAGPVGLLALQTANALGAAEVLVCDLSPERLALARDLGATAVVDVGEQGLDDTGFEADVLLECSGSARATADGVRRVGRAGRVVLVGMGGDEVTLPLAHVQQHELVVTGTFRYANTWPTATALAGGDVELDRLVTHRFGLGEVDDALTVTGRDPTAVKPVVRPQE